MTPASPPAIVLLLPVNDEPYHAAKERVVAHFEKEYFARLVSRAGGNMSKAARLAGVDRTTLYRLMDKHHIPAMSEAETPSERRTGRSRCFAGCSTKPRSTSWTTGMSSGRMPPPVRMSSRRWERSPMR